MLRRDITIAIVGFQGTDVVDKNGIHDVNMEIEL